MSERDALLISALEYHSQGLNVVPLHSLVDGVCTCGKTDCDRPGKHPRMRWRDLQDRPLTREAIEDYWENHPNTNVGVITGRQSGIAVLDLDGPEGLDSLRQAGIDPDELPLTPTVITGGGGLHYYFRLPEDGLKTRGGILPKVDIRADGGLAVLPPSMHVSGNRYVWEQDRDLDVGFASFDWSLLQPEKKTEKPTKPRSKAWYEELLSGMGEGGRNEAAARLAGRYFRMGLSEREVFLLLRGWNNLNDPPLPIPELKRTVQSIYETDKDAAEDPDDREMIGKILRMPVVSIRRITGDDPKVFLEFETGTAMLTTGQLLSPARFQQAVAEATKVVPRRLSSKTVPTHDRLAQMILAVSEDVDAGEEATESGELMLMIADYISSYSLLPSIRRQGGEIPLRGPFQAGGSIWFSATDLIQRMSVKWGNRMPLNETVQMFRALNLDRDAFPLPGGGEKNLWGIAISRVPFVQVSMAEEEDEIQERERTR